MDNVELMKIYTGMKTERKHNLPCTCTWMVANSCSEEAASHFRIRRL